MQRNDHIIKSNEMNKTAQTIKSALSAVSVVAFMICSGCDASGDTDQEFEELPPLLEFCYHQCSMGAHCDISFYLFYEDENQCRVDCQSQERSDYKQCLEELWPTEFVEARQKLNACLLSLHKCTQWRAYYDSDPEEDTSYPCKEEETHYLEAKSSVDEASINRTCHDEVNETDQ